MTLLTAVAALVAGALPAASAKPEPEPRRLALHHPYWSAGLRLGGAMPLGDLAIYNGAGPSAGLDLAYQGTAEVATAFYLAYSTQPYKLGGQATPLNTLGLGVRLMYELTRVEAVNAWVGAGGGYYLVQRTRQNLKQPVVIPLQYEAGAESTGGLGLGLWAGSAYQWSPSLALTLELGLVSIGLAGGTADTVTLGLPALGLRYDFF